MRAALRDEDREVRIAGGLGLAKLASPDSAPALLAAERALAEIG